MNRIYLYFPCFPTNILFLVLYAIQVSTLHLVSSNLWQFLGFLLSLMTLRLLKNTGWVFAACGMPVLNICDGVSTTVFFSLTFILFYLYFSGFSEPLLLFSIFPVEYKISFNYRSGSKLACSVCHMSHVTSPPQECVLFLTHTVQLVFHLSLSHWASHSIWIADSMRTRGSPLVLCCIPSSLSVLYIINRGSTNVLNKWAINITISQHLQVAHGVERVGMQVLEA